MEDVDVSAVVADLRARGIDVIRASYTDMIGTDRGRDVLIDELQNVMGHGMAFCRAVFHTSPMGDVVPVQGGIEDGLPDIKAIPDLNTLTTMPWEDGVAWVIADTFTHDGDPAPESPPQTLQIPTLAAPPPARRPTRQPRASHVVRPPAPACRSARTGRHVRRRTTLRG